MNDDPLAAFRTLEEFKKIISLPPPKEIDITDDIYTKLLDYTQEDNEDEDRLV